MKPFLVTGMGRCGTMFLAEQLNRSERYTVRHESTPLMSTKVASPGYWKPWTGEVNGKLRYVAHLIPVHKAVILRPILDIARSHLNRRGEDGFLNFIGQLRADCRVMANMIDSDDFIKIRFEDMVKSPDNLRRVAVAMGVDDDIDFSMEKVNHFPGNQDLDAEQKDLLRRTLGPWRVYPRFRTLLLGV